MATGRGRINLEFGGGNGQNLLLRWIYQLGLRWIYQKSARLLTRVERHIRVSPCHRVLATEANEVALAAPGGVGFFR